MKKVFLLIATTILLTLNVSAQYKEFQFGLMGVPGYNWMRVSNDNISNVSNQFSYKYGLFGSFYATENYGFSTGIIIQANRANYDFTYVTDSFTSKYNHDFRNTYLQIPVLFKGRTDLLSRVRISGEFGCGLGFLVDHYDTYRNISGANNHLDVKYRTFCPSLILGLGTEIMLFKSSGLLLQITLDQGFTNIVKKTDETENYYNSPMKMTCLYFEIGFIF